MIFNSSTVKEYILSGARFVATIRRRGQYMLGKRVVVKVGDKKFHGEVVGIVPITPLSLGEYVSYSGFESVEDWLNEARRLHGTEIDSNKYEVIIVRVVT